MIHGDTAQREAGRQGVRPWLQLLAAAVASVLTLLLVDVISVFVRGGFSPDLNPDLWLAKVFDPDLWWMIGVVFAVAWVIAACGSFLAQALLPQSKRNDFAHSTRVAMLRAFLAATVIGSVAMVALVILMTEVNG